MTTCNKCGTKRTKETKHLFLALKHNKKEYQRECSECLKLRKTERYGNRGLFYKKGTNLVTKVISYPPTL
jgi:hypothetical protein